MSSRHVLFRIWVIQKGLYHIGTRSEVEERSVNYIDDDKLHH
jgi:hypothetical protein